MRCRSETLGTVPRASTAGSALSHIRSLVCAVQNGFTDRGAGTRQDPAPAAADAIRPRSAAQLQHFGSLPMPTRPIERLLFAQGGRCFFCQHFLALGEASIEHLVAKANGGGNGEENTVACCKALNTLMGRTSLKEKLRVILNQNGLFKCPDGRGKAEEIGALPEGALERVVAVLRKRSTARPRSLRTLVSSINPVSEWPVAGAVEFARRRSEGERFRCGQRY